MSGKTQNEKIILGLKVRQLRIENKLSFAELSRQTGMSVSYLNEIEKGKKYPKEDKIRILAEALNTDFAHLSSMELTGNLTPVGELLQSNFLNELPLDLFGIELAKVVEIIANAPLRVGAFISTLVELSRNYALREENFYFGALRSYLELNHNYFEDIEREVQNFVKLHQLPTDRNVTVSMLADLLKSVYGYQIVSNGLAPYPELKELRAVFVPQRMQLLLNSKLNDSQKAFQFGKELGFNYLSLKERANTSSLLKVKSFEEVLNHFKAGYFSAALLINRELFIKDIQQLFERPKWPAHAILALLEKYQSSPEMLFQRLTNILPRYFGLKKIFFLRFIHDLEKDSFSVDKELHLNQRHQPQGNGISEHYCRRWVSISLLRDLQKMNKEGKYFGTIVGVQRSRYFGTSDEYLCITIARPAYPTPRRNVSVTIGILIDADLHKKIRFWDDPAIRVREVNQTCERCLINDCIERAVPPTIVEMRNQKRAIQETLRRITSDR